MIINLYSNDALVQKQLVNDCVTEIRALKKAKFSEVKNISEIMKKYEEKYSDLHLR